MIKTWISVEYGCQEKETDIMNSLFLLAVLAIALLIVFIIIGLTKH